MHTEELFQVLDWVVSETRSSELESKYQGLVNILQQNSQNGQASQPFESQREELLTALGLMDLSHLSDLQSALLQEMDLLDVIGSNAVDTVNDVLVKNAIDQASAHKHIADMLARLKTSIAAAESILNSIKPYELLVPSNTEGEKTDSHVIRVTFQSESSASTSSKLRLRSNDWYVIFMGFGEPLQITPDEVGIREVQNGSILVDFVQIASDNAAIINVASFAIMVRLIKTVLVDTLEFAQKYYEAEATRIKLEQEREPADEDKELDEALKALETRQVKKLEGLIDKEREKVRELLEAEGHVPEGTKIDSAVKRLILFVIRGGDVDLIAPTKDVLREGEEEPQFDDDENMKVEWERKSELQRSLENDREEFRRLRQLKKSTRLSDLSDKINLLGLDDQDENDDG